MCNANIVCCIVVCWRIALTGSCGAMCTCGALGYDCGTDVSEDMHRNQSRHLSFSCRIATSQILMDPFVDSSLISLILIVSEKI